jgi:hypothetical protein
MQCGHMTQTLRHIRALPMRHLLIIAVAYSTLGAATSGSFLLSQAVGQVCARACLTPMPLHALASMRRHRRLFPPCPCWHGDFRKIHTQQHPTQTATGRTAPPILSLRTCLMSLSPPQFTGNERLERQEERTRMTRGYFVVILAARSILYLEAHDMVSNRPKVLQHVPGVTGLWQASWPATPCGKRYVQALIRLETTTGPSRLAVVCGGALPRQPLTASTRERPWKYSSTVSWAASGGHRNDDCY